MSDDPIPRFDVIKNSDFEPAIRQGIYEENDEIRSITNCISRPTFANTIEKLDSAGELLERVTDVFYNLLNAASDEEKEQLAEKFKLNSSYYDKNLHRQIDYQVENIPGGAAIMFGAGLASGMLGIGSGAFKVMAMDGAMKMPLKPSSATSNLMMGVTAAASATVYFFNGSIKPEIAVPLALGIIGGATVGSRIMQLLPSKIIRGIFIPILLYLGLQMILKGFGVTI